MIKQRHKLQGPASDFSDLKVFVSRALHSKRQHTRTVATPPPHSVEARPTLCRNGDKYEPVNLWEFRCFLEHHVDQQTHTAKWFNLLRKKSKCYKTYFLYIFFLFWCTKFDLQSECEKKQTKLTHIVSWSSFFITEILQSHSFLLVHVIFNSCSAWLSF